MYICRIKMHGLIIVTISDPVIWLPCICKIQATIKINCIYSYVYRYAYMHVYILHAYMYTHCNNIYTLQ